MKKLLVIVPVFALLLAACRPQSVTGDAGYYSITAFRDALTKGKPVKTFTKTLSLNGQTETKQVTDSLHLQIAFFEEFEINKPAYRNSYVVDSIVNTDSTYKHYVLKPELKFPVKDVKYTQLKSGATTIECVAEVKNLLTLNKKNLQVHYTPWGGLDYTYTVVEELQGASPTTTVITLN